MFISIKKPDLRKFTAMIKKYPYHAIVAVALLVILLLVIFNGGDSADSASTSTEARSVSTISVADYSTGAVGSFAPTAAGNTFVVRAESSGKVTSATKAGSKVKQGDILARLDNRSQLAALTQAEGSYEAALASAARSDSSLSDTKTLLASAKQDVVEANRDALASYLNVLYNTVDQLFTNPRLPNPGVRIDGQGKADELNSDRYQINTTVSNWQSSVSTLSSSAETTNLINVLDEDINRINELSIMIDTFITLLPKADPTDAFSVSDLASLQSQFATAKSTLNSSRSSLQSTKTALLRAEEAVNSASIAASGSEVSSADAAVKQALGSLLAAQATYEKTIVRAPFAGTIVSVNVVVGDIINTGSDVAIISPLNTTDTEKSFDLPLSAVKFTPAGTYVFTLDPDNTLRDIPVEAGLVTTNRINVSGLNGDERIVEDVRGLKAGVKVNTN